MSASIVVYVGLLLAGFTIALAAFFVYRRLSAVLPARKIDLKTVQRWESFEPARPVPHQEDEDEELDEDQEPSRARQNGHYTQSKRIQ